MGVIQRQGIVSTVITYLGIAVGFISLLVIQPNFLTTEEIGLVRILYSVSFLISTVVPLSAGNITSKFLPKFRDEKTMHNGFLGFILLFPIIGMLLFFPVLFLFKDLILSSYVEESYLFTVYFYWIFPLSACISLSIVLNNYLFSLFKPVFPSFIQEFATRFAFIIIVFIYSFGKIELDQFIQLYFLIYLIQFIVLYIYSIRYNSSSLRFDRSVFSKSVVLQMFKYGYFVFTAGVASMAIKLMDAIVLGQFVPLALVGVYSVAAYIPIFIEAPINALDKVANARISHSWEKNDLINIQEIYFKSARYLFILGGFLFLMVSLNAEHLFHFLPNNFIVGVPVVEILSLSALFNLMTGSNSAIIFTSEKFTAGAIGLILVAVFNLVLLYTLIPVLGIEGAAWATCSASFAYNLFKYLYIWKKFKMQPFDKRTLFIGLSILFTYFIVSFIPLFNSDVLNIIITSLSVIAFYGIFIWFTRVADDLKEMIPFFKK